MEKKMSKLAETLRSSVSAVCQPFVTNWSETSPPGSEASAGIFLTVSLISAKLRRGGGAGGDLYITAGPARQWASPLRTLGCPVLIIRAKLIRLPAGPLWSRRDRRCSRAGRDRQPCRRRSSGISHRGNTAPCCTCRPCIPLERQ